MISTLSAKNCATAFILVIATALPAGAGETFDELLEEARGALRAQQPEQALGLLDRAIALAPEESRGYQARGDLRAALRKPAEAVADYDRAIQLAPRRAALYDARGSEQFKLGKIEASIEDFDRAITIQPESAAGHWKRGISYYYAGRFDDGRKQFEGYQTVDNNDVENATWRYLCMARSVGFEKARADILKIGRDARVPMMEVYALYSGRGTPEDVLAAVERGAPNAAQKNDRLFYAHLYLGLYYEAAGDAQRAAEQIELAVKHPIGHYMWDVAKVHAARFRAGAEKPAPANSPQAK